MELQCYFIIVKGTSVSLTNIELLQRYDLHNVISNAAFDSVSDGCRRPEWDAVAMFRTPLKSADCGTVVRKAKVSGQLS